MCSSCVHPVTPILIKSLHWLTMNQKIQDKVLCLTHKSVETVHPSFLRSLLSLTRHRSTRSSSLITLSRPSITFGLKLSYRSFFHSAPVLWKSTFTPSSEAHHSTSTSPTSGSCISDLPTSVFLKNLKSHLFCISFPPSSVLTCDSLGRISLVLILLGLFISFSFRISSSSRHSSTQFSV